VSAVHLPGSAASRRGSRRAARLGSALVALGAVCAAPLGAGVPRDAVLLLEMAPGTPGSEPAGAPPRFVLLRDGQVFVGGSARVEAGRLERREAQALVKRAEALRKNAPRAPVAFGAAGTPALRLMLFEDDPLEILASGDPAAAPAEHSALASLVRELASFHHPTLRPYTPSSYALSARQARIAGGCRGWTFSFPLSEAVKAPRSVPAVEAEGWPTGAHPASVCVGDERYVVTLRPLLPGELP
jgi:hypothetical protein